MQSEQWRILVTDDDMILRQTLVRQLLADGFDVLSAASGAEALEHIEHTWPDIAILDLMMPGMTGFELADKLRRYIDIPIIMLTSISDEATTVQGLEHYADDYLAKPYRYSELRARIRNLLSKAYASGLHPGEKVIIDETLMIDFGQHIIQKHGETISLEPIELRIIYLLLQTPHTAVTTNTLLNKAWGHGQQGDQSSLWVRIRSLRRKIEPNPSKPTYLHTVRGIGYMWAIEPKRGL